MSLDKLVNKGFVRYTKKHFPEEADAIIKKAKELYPEFHAKAPDIGGSANNMAYNLDMMITAVSYYEASDHRIGGEAFGEIAQGLLKKYDFVKKVININKPWQMKLLKKSMYNRYVPYAKLVDEKTAKGEWGNTWRVKINPKNIEEGVSFDLVGCPLADYAKANGYEELLPHMCAVDHLMPQLVHAKLIRTHTCATGSDSCDYWYVADESETARNYKGKLL